MDDAAGLEGVFEFGGVWLAAKVMPSVEARGDALRWHGRHGAWRSRLSAQRVIDRGSRVGGVGQIVTRMASHLHRSGGDYAV